jgi:RHS repeat-associated protein
MTAMNELIRTCLAIILVGLATLMASLPAVAVETVEYIHTDALGSPVATTDASGNVIERTVYEPYGAVVNGPLKDGPGYAGHVTDSGTGLSYMQQRYMDPQVGAFLSVDPISAYDQPVTQFGRYRYGNGNPYRFTDPDGRESWDRASFQTGFENGTLNASRGEAGFPSSASISEQAGYALGAGIVRGGSSHAGVKAPLMRMQVKNGGLPKPPNKPIYRMGTSKESPTRLGNKAAEAESAIGQHGVSGSTSKPAIPCSSSSCSKLESAGFSVRSTPTRNDPNHVTIELPKPVTKEVADRFNKAFDR